MQIARCKSVLVTIAMIRQVLSFIFVVAQFVLAEFWSQSVKNSKKSDTHCLLRHTVGLLLLGQQC
ncbi:hypothetical protein PUN28_015979 [Cardiocondyla obscurior]|uniref:Secreted protein n=1 Tax=Cardiocondyla obscurior TaxID=286306 RepID=A0AAW2EQC2_9HYME